MHYTPTSVHKKDLTLYNLSSYLILFQYKQKCYLYMVVVVVVQSILCKARQTNTTAGCTYRKQYTMTCKDKCKSAWD